MDKINKAKKNKFSLWCLAVWNVLIFGVFLFLFVNLLKRRFAGAYAVTEELVFLVLIPVFLIVNIKRVFTNIRKLYLSYRESSADEIPEDKPGTVQYTFMCMYQKLSRRRICLTLLLPILFAFAAALTILILSDGMFSWESVLLMFSHRSIRLAFLPSVLIPLFISLRIYLLSRHNLHMLQRVYDSSQRQELEAIDSIREKQMAYVFTREYLINWDSCLNIIPLKEIKKIEYVKYFYLFLYGTRLRIFCNKKYIIWAYGPSEREWIDRGFIPPSDQSGKSISFEINFPT